jgi:hypothetical protein
VDHFDPKRAAFPFPHYPASFSGQQAPPATPARSSADKLALSPLSENLPAGWDSSVGKGTDKE